MTGIRSRVGSLIRVGLVVGLVAAVAFGIDAAEQAARTVLDDQPSTSADDGDTSRLERNALAGGVAAVSTPVSAATMVCPHSAGGGGLRTRATAVAAPEELPAEAREVTGAPRVALTELGKGKPRETGDKRGAPLVAEVSKSKVRPLIAEAHGALAPGTVAGAMTRAAEGRWRGLAETRCVSPGSEFWFVGAGSAVGRHPRLFLTNIETTDAMVDLTLHDGKGRIQSDAIRGIGVPAGEQVQVELDRVAPTSGRLAVAVSADRGRITAALRDDVVDGSRSAGVDWVPAAVAPKKTLVIPGVPGGEGRRLLSIVAPGADSAVVELTLLGGNGPFQPAENDLIHVSPDSVEVVDLAKVAGGQPVAVRLESEVKVTAGVRVEVPRPQEEGAEEESELVEFAHLPAATPLDGPAVVPATLSGSTRTNMLLLSTPGEQGTTASVEVLAPDGKELAAEQVDVPAGGTAELELPADGGDDGYTTVVTPTGGVPVYGARILTENLEEGAEPGPMISAWPLVSTPVMSHRPQVVADPGAG